MSKMPRILLLAALTALSTAAPASPPPAQAVQGARVVNAPAPPADDYGDKVRLKLASGIMNMMTGFVEVPKNMINTANNTSSYGSAFDRGGYVLWGITGGGLKGAMHMLGRTLAGLTDFVTCFVPTEPITHPAFVWQNFYTDTQYGPYFKVDSQPKPAAPAPRQ